eukprot:scaffold289626_cov31-Tisochrysis_lutea.AAC.2
MCNGRSSRVNHLRLDADLIPYRHSSDSPHPTFERPLRNLVGLNRRSRQPDPARYRRPGQGH